MPSETTVARPLQHRRGDVTVTPGSDSAIGSLTVPESRCRSADPWRWQRGKKQPIAIDSEHERKSFRHWSSSRMGLNAIISRMNPLIKRDERPAWVEPRDLAEFKMASSLKTPRTGRRQNSHLKSRCPLVPSLNKSSMPYRGSWGRRDPSSRRSSRCSRSPAPDSCARGRSPTMRRARFTLSKRCRAVFWLKRFSTLSSRRSRFRPPTVDLVRHEQVGRGQGRRPAQVPRPLTITWMRFSVSRMCSAACRCPA